MMKTVPLKRILSFCLDWFVLALWGGALFVIAMIITSGNPSGFGNPWKGQLVSFLVMTLPFILYFAICESSSKQASLGKQICKIKVQSNSGQNLSLGHCILRNGLKFIPWEFGHAAAHHAVASGESVGFWPWVFLILATMSSLWWVIALLFKKETPYNQWVGARVVLA